MFYSSFACRAEVRHRRKSDVGGSFGFLSTFDLSTLDFRPSAFGFRISFDLRPSTFDLRLSALPQVPPRMHVVPNIGTVGIERAVGTVSEPIGIVIISRLVLSEHHFPK